MDWFSWLSKTGLEASIVYEYGLKFGHNELEEEDMFYFNHEFLQSMGISIAKHRLEILKLARKEKGKRPLLRPMARLVAAAIKRTKKSLANYVRSTLTHNRQESESALVVVPAPTTRRSPSSGFVTRWKIRSTSTTAAAMMKRNKMLMGAKQERLFLTNASPTPNTPTADGFSSPVVYRFQKMDGDNGRDDGHGYWSAAVQHIKWDTMFQDLNPN